nr:MAG TPA: hypothetical protein [Caudoviricetes sp.]
MIQLQKCRKYTRSSEASIERNRMYFKINR